MKLKKQIFPKTKSLGKRLWGKEELLVLIPGVLTLKKLTINKNSKGGLQFHRLKNECGILLSGKLKIIYFNKKKLTSKILNPGQCFHFSPGTIHQEIALKKCVIIEASSPHLNDRVRVESLFGLKDLTGLPTTKKKEILKL
tara:strand:+ start:277 stop:699 length:423 start_codon:yes stop_codon:yes gene_type:complete